MGETYFKFDLDKLTRQDIVNITAAAFLQIATDWVFDKYYELALKSFTGNKDVTGDDMKNNETLQGMFVSDFITQLFDTYCLTNDKFSENEFFQSIAKELETLPDNHEHDIEMFVINKNGDMKKIYDSKDVDNNHDEITQMLEDNLDKDVDLDDNIGNFLNNLLNKED